MEAGRLRHRVLLQSVSEGRDTAGAIVETWSDIAEVWGSVEPLRGDEFFESQRVDAELTYRIRIRYRPGLKSKDRVLYDSRTFDIRRVININERRAETHLMCRELPDA